MKVVIFCMNVLDKWLWATHTVDDWVWCVCGIPTHTHHTQSCIIATYIYIEFRTI